jgi:hypothetical protein
VLGGLLAALWAMLLLAGSAAAAGTGQASQSVATGSGSWGAGAAASGATPNGAYVLTWNLTGTLISQYFQVVNTGTLNLTGQTYAANNSKPTNGNAPPTIALDGCLGANWNTVLGTCAGTVVRLTDTSQSSTTTSAAIAAGTALSVRAQPITLPNYPQPYNTTLTITVTRNQTRPATTYNT